MAYINMDIDLDDIMDGLTAYEKQEIVDQLYQDGFYQKEFEKEMKPTSSGEVSLNEQMFREELNKIRTNYLNLTTEEQELIQKIAKRF